MSITKIQKGVSYLPPRIVFYGTDGIGKTSFAASAPNPIFIQAEEGAELLGVDRFPPCDNYAELIEYLRAVYQDEHSYKTLVIDTIDWCEKLVFRELRQSMGDEKFESYGRGTKSSIPYIVKLLEICDKIRAKKKMAIILLGHSQTFRYDDPMTDSYDRHDLALYKNNAAVVREWCDACLFATYKTRVKTTDVGFEKKKGRGLGNGERIIYTQERPSHQAKNRYDLKYELPFPKENGFQVLIDTIPYFKSKKEK